MIPQLPLSDEPPFHIDPEVHAIARVCDALDDLPERAMRERVLRWAARRFLFAVPAEAPETADAPQKDELKWWEHVRGEEEAREAIEDTPLPPQRR